MVDAVTYSARCDWCQTSIECNKPEVLHDWQANHGQMCPMNPPRLLARIDQLEHVVRQILTTVDLPYFPGLPPANTRYRHPADATTAERQHHAHD